jgi:hypothetical protein
MPIASAEGSGVSEYTTMLVNFMIIGAQKCGTTSLAEQLAQHQEVCFCRIKEPGYFHQTAAWQTNLAEYHRLYEPVNGQLCGEASTFYTFLPEWRGTHERLHAYNPALKLIYIMRQPVERIISNYAHELVRGAIKAPPEQVVFADPGYVNRSRYGVQIRPYLELFKREQLLLLVFEEYTKDQAGTLRQIAHFLNIAPDGYATEETTHAHKTTGEPYLKFEGLRNFVRSPWFQAVRTHIPAGLRKPVKRALSNTITEKPNFSPELKRDLWRLVEDDVGVVEELLGRRLDLWRRGYTS